MASGKSTSTERTIQCPGADLAKKKKKKIRCPGKRTENGEGVDRCHCQLWDSNWAGLR